MGLGDLVESGFNAIMGNEEVSHSSLTGFIEKYNNPDSVYVDQIDTLHTFDIQMAFYPSIMNSSTKGLLDSILDSATDALMKIGNNITGGLLGSILRDISDENLKDLQKKFIDQHDGSKTFMNYLSKGNLITDNEIDVDQLVMDLSYYVQNVTIPNITIENGENVQNILGQFPINGTIVKPSQNTFQMSIINTKAPLMERIFYPWMKEVTMPFWSYKDQPYTTANITIDFNKHSDMKYLFVGCRPQQIDTLAPSNELGTPTRAVTMAFDHMFVNSDLKAYDSTASKLWDIGKSLLNDAGKTLGL